MTKPLIILALFIGVQLCPPTEAAAAFVLGPEAEIPVMRWLDGLNLKLDNVRIKGGEVVVTATGCTLTLGHADHSECAVKVTLGTTAVCMQGRRCPSAKTIKRRPLTLPYRTAERSPDAEESVARARLRRAKVEAQRRFDIQQPGAARDALLPLSLIHI